MSSLRLNFVNRRAEARQKDQRNTHTKRTNNSVCLTAANPVNTHQTRGDAADHETHNDPEESMISFIISSKGVTKTEKKKSNGRLLDFSGHFPCFFRHHTSCTVAMTGAIKSIPGRTLLALVSTALTHRPTEALTCILDQRRRLVAMAANVNASFENRRRLPPAGYARRGSAQRCSPSTAY